MNKEVDILGPTIFADRMFARMSDDGTTYLWDEDRGTKIGIFYSSALRAYVYLHMSVCTKSPDYLTNSSLGRWVFATSH
ncbi:MAG: hypothetical protein QXS98_03800 [Candidatus Nitrosocaldus sp.]